MSDEMEEAQRQAVQGRNGDWTFSLPRWLRERGREAGQAPQDGVVEPPDDDEPTADQGG